MNFRVKKKDSLNGKFIIPGDKSISHRSIMCASIADGESKITGFLHGDDCLYTAKAFTEMGVKIDNQEGRMVIKGVGMNGLQAPKKDLYLGNSGTSMRLMAGLLAGQNFSSKLTGDKSLSQRPMLRIVEPLRNMGAEIFCEESGTPPVSINHSNNLNGFKYTLPIASAQVKSSLMFAALYGNHEMEIVENEQTRDHTEKMFKKFGVNILVEKINNTKNIKIENSKSLLASDINIPGDFSSAAFFILAALINPNSEILLENIGLNPTRTALLDALIKMGADIQIKNILNEYEPSGDILIKTSNLIGIDLDEKLVPNLIDELPVLFIAAAFASGETRIRGAQELRAKESDRLEAMSHSLKALGVNFKLYSDGIDIEGQTKFNKSIKIDSFGDHRIAMASAIACSRLDGENEILNIENVSTSFPNFIDLCKSSGINIDIN